MAAQAHTFDPPGSLSRPGLASGLRGLWLVFVRSWKIFIRYPSWIIGLVIWPVIFPAVYILGARALAGPDGRGLAAFSQLTGIQDYMGYIAVGTTIWMWQNIVLWNVGFALREEQRRGTLEANWLTPTWRFSFLLGSSMTQLISMIIFLAISALEFGLFFGVRFHGSPLAAAAVLLASIPAIYGLGFAFASLVIFAKEAHTFVFLVRGLVMIFCGITFPITILPLWMQGIARWLPQSYMIHAVREAVLRGASLQELAPDLLVLLGFGAGWLALGFFLFDRMERLTRRTGSLGQH